jgi:hypothetical protein
MTSWWQLAGPSAFLDQVIDAGLGPPSHGVIGIAVPAARPPHMAEALADRCAARGGWMFVTHRVSPADLPAQTISSLVAPGRDPAHGARELARRADLGDAFVWLEFEQSADDAWPMFLRAYVRERRLTSSGGPVLVVPSVGEGAQGMLDGSCPRITWRGRISRADSTQFVNELTSGRVAPPVSDLLTTSTIVEFAGPDLDLAAEMSTWSDSQLLDPVKTLLEQISGPPPPEDIDWTGGYIDDWDRREFVHTRVLALRQDRQALARRLWRAHVGALFPWLEFVRVAVARAHERWLNLPATVRYDRHEKVIRRPEDVEFSLLRECARGKGSADLVAFLSVCNRMRAAIAHMQPAEPRDILEVDGWWRRCGRRYWPFGRDG